MLIGNLISTTDGHVETSWVIENFTDSSGFASVTLAEERTKRTLGPGGGWTSFLLSAVGFRKRDACGRKDQADSWTRRDSNKGRMP